MDVVGVKIRWKLFMLLRIFIYIWPFVNSIYIPSAFDCGFTHALKTVLCNITYIARKLKVTTISKINSAIQF